MARYTCNICKFTFPESEFHLYEIKKRLYRCKICSKPVLADRIRKNVKKRENRRGSNAISIKDIRLILRKFKYSSCLSNSSNDLTIVRFYINIPLVNNFWNAVVITSKEAQTLPRKNQQNRSNRFPDDLKEKMENNYNKIQK